MDLINVMKVLSDETRIRILNLLRDGKLCVCEIEYLLNISQSNASRHLNKLTTLKLICSEKRALYVFYRINEDIYNVFPFTRYFIETEITKIDKCKSDTEGLLLYKSKDISYEELAQKRLEKCKCNL